MHYQSRLQFSAFCQIAVLGLAPLAQGQDLVEAETAAFNRAVASAAECVVQIETFGMGQQTAGELVANGPTTGTILSEDGLIVTSLFSFQSQPASILVSLPGGKRAAAEIVARDFSRELVLLRVQASGLPTPIVAPKSEFAVGQWAIALGKTYDSQAASRSVGIISALGRAYGRAIQTDAKISPINYGGPLIDVQGRVLGILSPVSPGTFLEGDSSELYDSGIGFAIPLEDILQRLPRLSAGEDLHSGKLGVVVRDQNELSGPVVITGASPGTPAAKAGIQAGDQIVEAAGQPVRLYAHLRHALASFDAGESFRFKVLRDGKELEFECELAQEVPIYRRRHLGLYLAAGSEADSADASPTQILAVEPGSPAAQAGLAAGDNLLKIGENSGKKIEDARHALAVAELDEPISLQVQTAGNPRTVELLPQEWPAELPEALPPPRFEFADEEKCTTSDIKLGDFPNDCYAILPPAAARKSPGLLIVLAEPGELGREKSLNFWNDFCMDYGWIVVVINSKDAKAWSREELELPGRVLGKLDSSYDLDPSRIVMAGFGVGGRLALAAAAESKRAVGVLTLGTQLGRIGLRKANSPEHSVHFLFFGDAAETEDSADRLRAGGYDATAIAHDGKSNNSWDEFPSQTIRRWLEGLARL